jgi:hypothetical protein
MTDEFDDRSREDEAPEDEAADEQAPLEERPEEEPEAETKASEADIAEDADLEHPADETGEEEDAAQDESAEADTDVEDWPGEGAEEETEEAAEEEHEPGAFLRPDGLDSGLSWFGAEPFIPPLPPGSTPPERPGEASEEEDEAAAAVLSASERRQQVRDRLHARRAEKKADRRWYQRIPIPVYFTLPVIIFTVCYVLIVAPPWKAIPGPKADLDSALLKAEAVEDQDARLEEMGIEVKPGDAWRLLPGGELVMADGRRKAAVLVTPEEPMTDCEASVEVCLVGPSVGATVWLGLNEGTGTALGLARMNRQKHLVRKHGFNRYRSEMEFQIQPNAWYTLAIRVEGKRTGYYLNGRELSPVSSRPPEVSRMVLAVEEARAAFRNWQLRPLK